MCGKNGRPKGEGKLLSDEDNNNLYVCLWQNTRLYIMLSILDYILLGIRNISQSGYTTGSSPTESSFHYQRIQKHIGILIGDFSLNFCFWRAIRYAIFMLMFLYLVHSFLLPFFHSKRQKYSQIMNTYLL